MVAVVVVGAWKGSGRWTETLSVEASWVIWTDRPNTVTAVPPAGFLSPSAADLRRSEMLLALNPLTCLYTASFIQVLLQSDADIVFFFFFFF